MTYSQALDLLDCFVRDVESGVLWAVRDETAHGKRRRDLWRALDALLVWHRPRLEAGPGLDHPYHVLKQTAPILQRKADRGEDPFLRAQASLYLTLLPFPGQWNRLAEAEDGAPPDSETAAFLRREREMILEKVRQKADRTFRVRHFLQVLKRPQGPDEKGVLRLFSLPYLLADPGLLRKMSRRYVFFVEPPMGVVWRHGWWRHFCRLNDPCLFGVGGPEDARFLQTQSGTLAVGLAHGDFLEDEPPVPPTVPPVHDMVFNATFDDVERKRHDLMLDLLDHRRLRDRTVLFLGRGVPERVRAFEDRVAQRGLTRRVTVRANLRRSQIPALLARCRVGVHLSLYENACRAVYEFFRADLPCVVSSSMAGMNPAIFNEETGLAVPDADLADAVASVLEDPGRFSPRRWFLRESGSAVSSRRLNAVFRKFFAERGYRWTEDLVALGSSGARRYVSRRDEARFADEHAWIARILSHREHLPVAVEA
ncbi:Glycosyltransferase involved in cell wall bisynthesis [Desulfacinum hydrothermale DSM 13146]|uniref:Glycosyltransferase involved in cell wall bisynthesis n=1 Tax=Desulfacinum hydrothermale DSM 13146 TaxID=1121390 RepID=A0A1W1WZW4_9BACT|nr:glycosyltransferase [Desulfacinum hydrothermale]SMC17194.1 Glycosyltransferase involved in cell wall bisynthesis [Desulfacinum hydrothermale DSM 13146]